jgi:hypothetical protein
MSDVGWTFDALIFVEVELGENHQVYLSAFSAMRPDTDYRLIGIESQVNPGKLAELSDPIFYPGAQITLADGLLCAAENLKPGQKLLSQDFAEQNVICVKIKTQRTQGKIRPIWISKSYFGTDPDLILSAEHDILYPQTDGSHGGQFIKAMHLYNGTTIDWVEASFVDCVQIRFATESLILPMAFQCNLTCAAKIEPASHPKDYRGLYNPHLTPQNPARAVCICPEAYLIRT